MTKLLKKGDTHACPFSSEIKKIVRMNKSGDEILVLCRTPEEIADVKSYMSAGVVKRVTWRVAVDRIDDGENPGGPNAWNRQELELMLEVMANQPFWNVWPGKEPPERVRRLVLNLARYFKIKPEELAE